MNVQEILKKQEQYVKGIANGAPMGSTVATAEVADSFGGLTISTFGGNPVSPRPSTSPRQM